MKKKFSRTLISEGRQTHKVTRFDSTTESRQFSVRAGPPAATSDYSSASQSDGEQQQGRGVSFVTSTPINPRGQDSRLGHGQGSPRLRAWEGDGWVWSPRTSYTYAKSLTYRDAVTPGRDIPMPHMTRLPLYGYPGATTHTELWELSQDQAELSSIASPHLIYRRTAHQPSLLRYLTLQTIVKGLTNVDKPGYARIHAFGVPEN